MTGIQFVTDAKGLKVAVLMDIKKHDARLEEGCDGLIAESRRKERAYRWPRSRRTPCVDSYAIEIKPSASAEVESLLSMHWLG